MATSTESTSTDRAGIIRAVKTPLGFFVLAILIVEVAMFGTALAVLRGSDRTYVVIGSIGLMFLLVVGVGVIAVYRPEALLGKRPPRTSDKYSGLSATQQISMHEQAIEKLTRDNILQGFNVPEGYKAETSKLEKYRFAFCYPVNWKFATLPDELRYGFAAEEASAGNGFARNVNVVIDDIRDRPESLDVLYESVLKAALISLPDAELVFQDEHVVFQGLIAARWRLNWTPQLPDAPQVTSYQVVVADSGRTALYTVTFTSRSADFESSRPLFDNIASTFRI